MIKTPAVNKMTSEKRKSKRASKFGRKGDDRMHRSLQARLSNPKLPLLDALLQGGYHFRNDKEGNTVDTDNVQLSQRRNQLSRRIRLHKQQHGEASAKDEETAAPEASPAVANRTITCLPTNRHVYPNDLHYANQVFARQHPVSFAPRSVSVGMPNSINRMRCIPAAPPAPAPMTNDVITSVDQRDEPNNQDAHHYQRSNSDKDSEIQSRALNSFRVDVASLLKKSMLSAGFQQEQTEECDEAYLAFAERALSEETRRIKRIKSKLHPVVQVRGNTGQIRNHVSFNTDHLVQNNSHAYNNGHSQNNIQSQSQSQSQNNDRSQGNGQTHNNGLILTHDQGHNHSHDHDHSQCRPNNTFLVENSAQTTNPKRNHTEVSASTAETKKSCIHARHFHRLEGKCGHKAILHRPPNGSAHIDFLVDGKIECYQNYQPMADAAASFWPSKFSCEEMVDHAHEDEETGTNSSTNKCANKECDKFGTCDEEGTCKSIPYDPEILQLDDIDFNCDEWNPGISEDGRSNVDDEAVLGSLLKLSETT